MIHRFKGHLTSRPANGRFFYPNARRAACATPHVPAQTSGRPRAETCSPCIRLLYRGNGSTAACAVSACAGSGRKWCQDEARDLAHSRVTPKATDSKGRLSFSAFRSKVPTSPPDTPARMTAPEPGPSTWRAEIGAAWSKRSEDEGRDYLSFKLEDPGFTPNLREPVRRGERRWPRLIWSRPRKNSDLTCCAPPTRPGPPGGAFTAIRDG